MAGLSGTGDIASAGPGSAGIAETAALLTRIFEAVRDRFGKVLAAWDLWRQPRPVPALAGDLEWCV